MTLMAFFRKAGLAATVAVFTITGSLWAEPGRAPATQPTSHSDPRGITVGILDFAADASGGPELGKQISEALVATLSGQDGFTLVDRSSLARTLQEHELNLSGLVDSDQAIKIGRLVGAKVLVTGKAFLVGKQLYFTAKLIGTETSLVEGVLVKGERDADEGELLMKLADQVASRLKERGPKLVARDDAMQDPLPALKAALAGRKLPKVGVHVAERHVTQAPAARIDPAVETEIRKLLTDCGFTVVEGDERQLTAAGVRFVISGEAFSEFAARIGNLNSCLARVEVKVTDRKTGQVVFSDRTTTRAVDLAENVAGKTALQKGGRTMAIEILRQFERTIPGGR